MEKPAQLCNSGGPRVSLATGRMGSTVGIPTLQATERPTEDLHVLGDGATTLLASWCEALGHNGRRPPSARTESATIFGIFESLQPSATSLASNRRMSS